MTPRSPPRIDGAVDGVRLALAADRAKRFVHRIERERVRAHLGERISAAGDDLQSELDRLIAVAAHAFHRQEAGEQNIDVELWHRCTLAAADQDAPAFAG